MRASNAARTRFGLGLAERLEGRADLSGEELRLLPGCKVIALVNLVEVHELGVGLLGPTPRGLIELARKDAHGSRDGDVDGVETVTIHVGRGEVIFPIKTRRRNRRARQPVERDGVYEKVVGNQAAGSGWD